MSSVKEVEAVGPLSEMEERDEHFGDVESEGDEQGERERRVRRRRRTSSRPDSASDRSSSCQVQEEAEVASSSTGSDLDEETAAPLRKPRPTMKRRQRQPDEVERALREKVAAIDRALTTSDEGDGLDRLRQLATSEDGLMDDELRRRAWPRLANVPRMVESEVLPSQEECEAHPEYNQVRRKQINNNSVLSRKEFVD